jgi:hypothetical protein
VLGIYDRMAWAQPIGVLFGRALTLGENGPAGSMDVMPAPGAADDPCQKSLAPQIQNHTFFV